MKWLATAEVVVEVVGTEAVEVVVVTVEEAEEAEEAAVLVSESSFFRLP